MILHIDGRFAWANGARELNGHWKRLLLTAIVTASLTCCHRQEATSGAGKAGCGIKAELHSASVRPLYNPNTIDLEYLATNLSGKDYQLPNSFRALSKSSDNVLHADKNVGRTEPNFLPELSLREQRYFPGGQTTVFVVSINLYLSDHRPTTDEDKRQLRAAFGHKVLCDL